MTDEDSLLYIIIIHVHTSLRQYLQYAYNSFSTLIYKSGIDTYKLKI